MGDTDEAERVFSEIVKRRTESGGDADEDLLAALTSLAHVLQRNGKPQEALPYGERAVAGYSELLGREHPYTLTARSNLGILRMKLAALPEATEEFREILAIRRRTLPADHSDIGVSQGLLGNALRMAEQFDEAEATLLASYEQLSRAVGVDHHYTKNSASWLARLYGDMGRADEAERWRVRAGGESK